MAGAAAGVGSLAGGLGSLFTGATNLGQGLLGTEVAQDTSRKTSGTTTEGIDIDQAGINKIIEDVLGGADGLAAIFSGEQSAGIFDSSVAAQAAGDLASKLAGEIAKVTAKKTTKTDETEEVDVESDQAGFFEQVLGRKLPTAKDVLNIAGPGGSGGLSKEGVINAGIAPIAPHVAARNVLS